jgi:hypothetical protein
MVSDGRRHPQGRDEIKPAGRISVLESVSHPGWDGLVTGSCTFLPSERRQLMWAAFFSAVLATGPVERLSPACDYHNLPVHGTVRDGVLFGFFGGPGSATAISAIPTSDLTKKDILYLAYSECTAHARHHFFGKTVWFLHGPERVFWNDGLRQTDGAFPFPALKKVYERERGRQFGSIGGYDPAPGVAVDFVPLSDTTCRAFFYAMKTKKIETWETEWGPRKDEKQKKAKVRWVPVADERNPETIEAAFVEDFYVFKRAADYYFVTQSGKLYLSPPAKKGEKARTMKAVWDDAKRPIVAVLEDADNDKVWLFAKDKNDGAKLDLFFLMQETIRTQTFDPAKLKRVDIKGRAKTLLEYLPLISEAGDK